MQLRIRDLPSQWPKPRATVWAGPGGQHREVPGSSRRQTTLARDRRVPASPGWTAMTESLIDRLRHFQTRHPRQPLAARLGRDREVADLAEQANRSHSAQKPDSPFAKLSQEPGRSPQAMLTPPIGCSRHLDTRQAPLQHLPIRQADNTARRTGRPTIRKASFRRSPNSPNWASIHASLER